MPLYHQSMEPESESISFFSKTAQAKPSAAIYQLRSLEAVLHQRRVWLFFPAVWLIPFCFHSSVCFWEDKHWAVVLKGCNLLKYKINNWLWDKHFISASGIMLGLEMLSSKEVLSWKTFCAVWHWTSTQVRSWKYWITRKEMRTEK